VSRLARPPLIVIGLDAAEHRLVSRWCDAGDLPALRGIRDAGTSGLVRSPDGIGDDGAWASFCTGALPSRHGRYHHRQLRPGGYRVGSVGPLGRSPFWEVLSRAGRRVAIVDVPKSPQSTELNGVRISNWLVHGRNGDPDSFPAAIAPDLLRRYGDDLTDRWPGALCIEDRLPDAQHGVLIERALDSIERKTQVALELLERDAWDLFLVVFKEAHCVGHQLWHLTDETHPAHPVGGAGRGGDPVKRVYQALDATIARFLAAAGPGAPVVVFSGLGMAGNFTGEHLLDAILLRLDAARPLGWWEPFYRRGDGAASPAIRRVTRRLHRTLYPYRSAFQVEHNEISGAIRVNVRGREPRGRIRPGAELADFVDTLAADLLDLVDPDSGEPVVARVVRSDDAFAGEHRHRFPDLFAVWNRRPARAIASDKIGEIRAPARAWRTGNHTSEGFVLARGPRVAPGQSSALSITDLAPSICHMLGVPLPDADGRPIAALGA
jgi:predicted AlkP superfamily phosphohydrolase/phosphomutase